MIFVLLLEKRDHHTKSRLIYVSACSHKGMPAHFMVTDVVVSSPVPHIFFHPSVSDAKSTAGGLLLPSTGSKGNFINAQNYFVIAPIDLGDDNLENLS